MPARRIRRSAEEARTAILEAAERQLMNGGPESVRIQAIARELGVTDAAVHHHFGTREKLMTALLRFGGRRLREALRSALPSSTATPDAPFDLQHFLREASRVFGERGYARLALWLRASGWREQGSGIWDELAVGIARQRGATRPAGADRHLAALVALVLMAEPIFGDAARRSVSLPAGDAGERAFHAYLERTFEALARGQKLSQEA